MAETDKPQQQNQGGQSEPKTDTSQTSVKEQASKSSSNSYLQDSVIKLFENETSPEVLAIKRQILKRIALESDIKPARIPAPLNITQIGGYINLLEKLNLSRLQEQTLTSILGLPVQYDDSSLSKDIEISILRSELQSLRNEISALKSSIPHKPIPGPDDSELFK